MNPPIPPQATNTNNYYDTVGTSEQVGGGHTSSGSDSTPLPYINAAVDSQGQPSVSKTPTPDRTE
jgi:hypothetical protein